MARVRAAPAAVQRGHDAAHANLLRGLAATALAGAFGREDSAFVDEALASANTVELLAGDRLFDAGEPGDAAYVVALGRVRLYDADGWAFYDVDRGGLVGASALLEDGVRSAAAFAARDSVLVRLPRPAIEQLAERHPHAVLQLTRNLFASMAPPHRRRRPPEHRGIAILPASDDAEASAFAPRLVAALRKHGAAEHVTQRRASEATSRDGLEDGDGHVAITRWLYEMESAHNALVYDARGDPAWSRVALRQSDRVVVVASGVPARRAQDVAASLRDHPNLHASLVLLHRGAPSGTAAWLDALGVGEYYHVREGSTRDWERLARLLSGHATALVLGGGGARSFAHTGVLRALRERGIAVDFIAGCSSGAIIAAYIAAGRTEDEALELLAEGFADLRDPTIPVSSLIKGRRTTSVLQRQLGDVLIEDLVLPFFCVSADITANRAVYHDRGPLVRALRATSAIAGVYPPVPIDGHVHVDGGVMDNLPAREMRRRQPEAAIVAVDVSPTAAPGIGDDYGLWLSGWSAWRRRRRGPRADAPPTIAEALVRSAIAGSTNERMRVRDDGVADLFLALDVSGMAGLKAGGAADAARAAYEQAAPRVDAWLASRASASAAR